MARGALEPELPEARLAGAELEGEKDVLDTYVSGWLDYEPEIIEAIDAGGDDIVVVMPLRRSKSGAGPSAAVT